MVQFYDTVPIGPMFRAGSGEPFMDNERCVDIGEGMVECELLTHSNRASDKVGRISGLSC